MERKSHTSLAVAAFAVGVVLGGVWWSWKDRMDRWLALDNDRADEGRDALTNYLDTRFSDLVGAVKNINTSLDDLRTAVATGTPRRVASLPPPRDGGQT